jgi:hypothetical protein
MRSLLGAQAIALQVLATGGFSFYPSQAVAASTVHQRRAEAIDGESYYFLFFSF